MGPRVAIAKFISEQQEPNIQWELSKSEQDYIDPKSFASVLPIYIELTNQANKLIE